MNDQNKGSMAAVLIAAVAVGLAVWLAQPKPAPPTPPPLAPVIPPPPIPDKPCPPNRPCPREAGAKAGSSVDGSLVGGSVGGRDNTIQCDLPGDLHQKNTGGSDGAGLCVFASMRHAGRWQNDAAFEGLFDWMRHHPGGGYPEKVTKMLDQYCKEKGIPKPQYIQVEGKDLEILRLACKTGRMPCVTYSRSPTGRYGGSRIAHMVNIVRCDDEAVWVLDNNYIGESNYEKLSPAEFQKVYAPGWAIILLNPAPPPVPRN